MHVDTSKRTLTVPELKIYEKISSRYNVNSAKERALELIIKSAKTMGLTNDDIDAEITEESSFNMVRGSGPVKKSTFS